MAIVWPCTLSVDAYAAAGREVEVPRAHLPVVSRSDDVLVGLLAVRAPRGASPQDLGRPGLVRALRRHPRPAPGVRGAEPPRLDRDHRSRPRERGRARAGCVRSAGRLGLPHTTVRGWVRSFVAGAAALAQSFAALAVELGGEALTPLAEPSARRAGRHRCRLARRLSRCRDGWRCTRGVSVRRCAAGRSSPPTRTPPISSSANVVSCLLSHDSQETGDDDMDDEHAEAVALHRWAVIAEATERPARTGRTRSDGARHRRTSAHPSRRHGAPLQPGHHRPLDPGLASRRPRGASPRDAIRHRRGAGPPRAGRRGGGTAPRAAEPLGGPDRPDPLARHGIAVAERTVRQQLPAGASAAKRWPPSPRPSAVTRPRHPTSAGSPTCSSDPSSRTQRWSRRCGPSCS